MFSYIKKTQNGYLLELPLIKRFFDGIYISYINSSISKGAIFLKSYFKNDIFGISILDDFLLFYHFNLDKIEENEYLIKEYEIIDFKILNKNHSLIVLFLDNSIKLISSYKGDDFSIKIINNRIVIKNKVLNTNIFEKDIKEINEEFYVKKSVRKKTNIKDFTSILDIYFYKNYFIKINNYINKKLLLNILYSRGFAIENEKNNNEFFPKSKFLVYERGIIKKNKTLFEKLFSKKEKNSYSNLNLLKKYLLFKNNYNFTLDLINYDELKDYFNVFNSVKKVEKNKEEKIILKNLDLDLEKINPELNSINNQIQNFVLNYYNLDKNHENIKILKINLRDSKIDEQNLRVEIFKKSLEKIKKEYLKLFKDFLDKVK